ncbi:MAG: hypothetical protein KME11_04885 [Timaviella obliquedivisa GSE-PSE-MK23-08B]|jgi:hypothetical protein|nr:hypothetical protein [Timaviella obliquedivisa GSE-PSE-MK23-08B]
MEQQSFSKQYVKSIVNLQSQHLCHSVENKMICRGGRDLMLRVMFVQRLIEAPTDEAFDTARKEHLEQK